MNNAGKTAFLYYALVRALKEGLPVNWCIAELKSEWLQFDGKGNVHSYQLYTRIPRLSFFDQTPPHAMDFQEPGFVVQATSPQRHRYKEWAKQFRARFWVMENWLAEEIDIETRHRQMCVCPHRSHVPSEM